MHIPTSIAIIPARYASTRFPGKSLADINGKTMIRRVYERVAAVIDRVVVATDDERIYREVESFGGQAVMTSADHRSGTDRCAEALGILEKEKGWEADVIINIQGDEPFIRQEQIQKIRSCFTDDAVEIATLIRSFDNTGELANPNRAKVVIDTNGYALYFSRSVIPFLRNPDNEDWHQQHNYYLHIGMYAFRSGILKKLVLLKESSLEKAESLEQLRWLENGYRIKTAVTQHESCCIDTPDDLRDILKKGII